MRADGRRRRTLATDRLKGRTYGSAGIPRYWIVNLPERCVETYSAPSTSHETGYTNRIVLHDQDLLPSIFAEQPGAVQVHRLLP